MPILLVCTHGECSTLTTQDVRRAVCAFKHRTLQMPFHNRIYWNSVCAAQRSGYHVARRLAHEFEASSPMVGSRIVGVKCIALMVLAHQIQQSWSITHLCYSLVVIYEIFAHDAMAFHSFLIKQRLIWSLLFSVCNKSTIRGIILDKPEVWMMFHDIAVAVTTPFLIWSAYPVYAYFLLNIWCIMKSLSNIFESSPYKHPERTVVGTAGTLNNPLGTFGRAVPAFKRASPATSLLRNTAKIVCRWVFTAWHNNGAAVIIAA